VMRDIPRYVKLIEKGKIDATSVIRRNTHSTKGGRRSSTPASARSSPASSSSHKRHLQNPGSPPIGRRPRPARKPQTAVRTGQILGQTSISTFGMASVTSARALLIAPMPSLRSSTVFRVRRQHEVRTDRARRRSVS
jgi:hypothetical protein